MEINAKIQASSHSGAKLHVFKEGEDYYVSKKILSEIARNSNAIIKQARFKTLKTPTYDIKAIPIESINKDEGELVVTMPYIEGLGGEQVAYKGSKVVAKNLKVALDFYLISSLSECKDGVYPVSDIHRKIKDIGSKLESKKHIFPRVEEHIKTLETYSSKDLMLPLGGCHGDLTLSNLKVTEENQLMLFDFLECEINSPLQDAAKLIQDFEYGWSFRKEKESVRIKGEIFCEFSKPEFIRTLDRLFHYEMRIIEALTILRIAPYIQKDDKLTINWFNSVIEKTMKKIVG